MSAPNAFSNGVQVPTLSPSVVICTRLRIRLGTIVHKIFPPIHHRGCRPDRKRPASCRHQCRPKSKYRPIRIPLFSLMRVFLAFALLQSTKFRRLCKATHFLGFRTWLIVIGGARAAEDRPAARNRDLAQLRSCGQWREPSSLQPEQLTTLARVSMSKQFILTLIL